MRPRNATIPGAHASDVVVRSAVRRLVAVSVLVFALASCGGEPPTEYSVDNQEAFMAACADAPVDGILQQRVCLCVYEQAEATIPFDRFLEINDQLQSVEEPVLPDDLLELVSQCVIEEGDL